MNCFLKESKRLISLKKEFCVVIGNESCDLDSVVSSICLAFHYSRFPDKRIDQTVQCILPVINIPRIQLPLKTEVVYFLNKNNIELNNLVCRDEIDITGLEYKIDLILVDHHVSKFKNNILMIFDHRPFDSSSNLPENCIITIEQIGSCASLIANKIKESNCLEDSDYQDILKLLYGAIILDTVNFSVEADKARPLDIEMASVIDEYLKIEQINDYRNRLFNNLINARSDISSLDSLQILSKDLKIIGNEIMSEVVSIPGFPILVQKYISMENSQENVLKFAENNNSDVVVLMGMYILDGNVERDLGIVNIKNLNLFENIVKELKNISDIKLEEHCNCDFLNGKFYKQNNIKFSRKQILPVIKNLLGSS